MYFGRWSSPRLVGLAELPPCRQIQWPETDLSSSAHTAPSCDDDPEKWVKIENKKVKSIISINTVTVNNIYRAPL